MCLKPIFSIASCLAVLILLSGATATAQDMSVFGMRFGQPLTIPECPATNGGYRYYASSFHSQVCYERSLTILGLDAFKWHDKKHPPPVLPPLGTEEEVSIKFPLRETPDIANDAVYAILIDAKLEGISFVTRGIRDADLVLEKLKAKYGASPTLVNTRVQNRIGASFDAFYAIWIFPDLQAAFHSVSETLDHGLVIIDTNKGHAWREQRLKAAAKDKHPL